MLDQVIDRLGVSLTHWTKVRSWDGGLMWQFSSGYHFQFGHCAEGDDWERYYSNEVRLDRLRRADTRFFETVRPNHCEIKNGPCADSASEVASMSNLARKEKEKFLIRDPHWNSPKIRGQAPGGNTVLSHGSTQHRRKDYNQSSICRLVSRTIPTRISYVQRQLLSKTVAPQKALRDGDWYVTADSFYASMGCAHSRDRAVQIPLEWLSSKHGLGPRPTAASGGTRSTR